MSDEKTVQDNMVVSMDYTLRLEDGEVVDSSSGRDPLRFIQGQGQIIPGLESELYGLSVGDEKEVTVEAGQAYGEYNEDRVQLVPDSAFPDDMELEEGMAVQMQDSNTGQVYQAYITGFEDGAVVLDFNHPLAGETLTFNVEITDLRPASEEELSHGHAHGPGSHAH